PSDQLEGPVEAALVCHAVDHDETPVRFRIGSGRFTGVPTDMQPGATGFFKLYVDGRILWTGDRAHGTRLIHTVDRWPTLRGPKHDWSIELEPPEDVSWTYHDVNWWQFK